jgi:hypothetical protein
MWSHLFQEESSPFCVCLIALVFGFDGCCKGFEGDNTSQRHVVVVQKWLQKRSSDNIRCLVSLKNLISCKCSAIGYCKNAPRRTIGGCTQQHRHEMHAILTVFYHVCMQTKSRQALLQSKVAFCFQTFLPADESNGEGHSIGGGLLLFRVPVFLSASSGGGS